jgi:S1-C subfamily serine protease
MLPQALIRFKPAKTLVWLPAIAAFIWGVGNITAKEPAPSKIVTLEGKNFNKKDGSGETVTIGDDGWENALYYLEKEKEAFTGNLIIPYLKNGTNNVQAIISFEKGKQHGEATVWHKNGRRNAQEDFDAGKLTMGSYWLDDGKQDPAGNKDSSLGVSTKLLARLAVQALATRGGFGPPPEKNPDNIRFDNWIRYQANADQKRRNQECVNVLTAQYLKQGVGRNEAIYRAYCWIRAPQHRHRFIAYIVSGIDPQGAGIGLATTNVTKRPPLPNGIKGSGSGFFITNDGYLITNNHVAEKANFLTVRGHQATGGRELPAKIVALDKRNDLALLKVTGRFSGLPIVSSRVMGLGGNIFTIGYPRPDLQGVYPKFTRGTISSLAGLQDNPNWFQVSVATQPGNSGGPHLNSFGNVIGVHVAGLPAAVVSGKAPQLVNYAIKSDVLLGFLRRTGIRLNLNDPNQAGAGNVVKRTEPACVLILVY